MNSKLYDDINKEFNDESLKLFHKIIVKRQAEYQKKYYPDADPTTSIKCVICDGSYTPRTRFLHNRTRKHSKMVENIKNHNYDYDLYSR